MLTYTILEAVLCQRITTVPVATPVAACSSPPASPLHTPDSPHACELLDIRRRTTPRFPCRAAEIVRLGNVMRVGRRGAHAVHQARVRVHPNMHLHAEMPLIPLPSLVRLRVPLLSRGSWWTMAPR